MQLRVACRPWMGSTCVTAQSLYHTKGECPWCMFQCSTIGFSIWRIVHVGNSNRILLAPSLSLLHRDSIHLWASGPSTTLGPGAISLGGIWLPQMQQSMPSN